MTYIPVVLSTTGLEDKLAQNLHRLVDEFKLSNTTIVWQDSILSKSFPRYVIYSPEVNTQQRHLSSNSQRREAVCTIEYLTLPDKGYRQLSLMSDAFEKGLDDSNSLLKTARLRYKGKDLSFIGPIDIQGQRVFSKQVNYRFEVLL